MSGVCQQSSFNTLKFYEKIALLCISASLTLGGTRCKYRCTGYPTPHRFIGLVVVIDVVVVVCVGVESGMGKCVMELL